MKRLLFISIIFIFIFCPVLPQSGINEEILFETKKFREILEIATQNYVDSFSVKRIAEAGFNAMLKELDPHSAYFNSETYKRIQEANLGKEEGIGVSVLYLSDTLTVVSVTKGGPADSAGLIIGDKILFIDGENTSKMQLNEAVNRISGAVGTAVTLIVKRGYSSVLNEYVIYRKEVPLPAIVVHFLIPGTNIGYIKSQRFSKTSYDEFETALADLSSKKMEKLIIDLRGNSGGYIEQVCRIIDEFTGIGQQIVITKSRNSSYSYDYVSNVDGKYKNLPIVVIIDEKSASAAEIFAGVVQDLDRGIVVGNISYGKGLVQKSWQFKDGSAFNLTVARYYIPSGRYIQKPIKKEGEEGVLDPTVTLNMDEETQRKLQETIKKTGGQTNLPIYYTSKGRIVFGGGGIFPDYFSKEDTTTVFTNLLKAKGYFLEFAIAYVNQNKDEISFYYGDNLEFFIANFRVDDKILSDFVNFAKSKRLWNEKMFQTDKEYIRNFIKSAIAHTQWGDAGFYPCMLPFDKPLQDAISLLPEAMKMVNNN